MQASTAAAEAEKAEAESSQQKKQQIADNQQSPIESSREGKSETSRASFNIGSSSAKEGPQAICSKEVEAATELQTRKNKLAPKVKEAPANALRH